MEDQANIYKFKNYIVYKALYNDTLVFGSELRYRQVNRPFNSQL